MRKKIAICGKGGVGKSLLAYFVARALENLDYQVIVLDADESNIGLFKFFEIQRPPKSLIEFLGGRKKFKEKLKSVPMIEKEKITLDEIPQECKAKIGEITVILTGKIHEPMEGCACPMGVVSKEFIEKLELKDQEVLIVDTEAGIEHFGRGVEKGIDTVIIVAEPSFESIEVASKVWELAQKLRKDVYLILNKVPEGEIRKKLKKLVEEKELKPAGIIPYDEKVFIASLEGKSPPLRKAYQSVKNTIEHILKIISP